jgi:hypothetical protein
VHRFLRFDWPLSPLEWMRLTRFLTVISLAHLAITALSSHIHLHLHTWHLQVVSLPYYTHRTLCNPSTTLWGCGGESSHLSSTTATQPTAVIPAFIHCRSLTAQLTRIALIQKNTSYDLLQTNCSHACTCCCCWCRSPTFSSIKKTFLSFISRLFLCLYTVTAVIPQHPHVVYSPYRLAAHFLRQH